MKWWPWRWRSERRAAIARARQVTDDADESRAQAEADWMEAMERRPEAVRVTKALRDYNTANHYDDWLPNIVRR